MVVLWVSKHMIRIRSQNNCLVKSYPSSERGIVVNQLETPCSLFNSLRSLCSSLKVDRIFCNSLLWCCILVNFILLLIFLALLLVANCGCWLIMFVDKSFHSMVENSYSFCVGSENIGIPRPPNLGGRDINLLSVSDQFIPPVTAGINSVLITSSNCLSWVLMFGIVLMKYIGWCLNPLMKPEYAAWGSHRAILHSTHNSFIHWSIFSWTYFCLNVFDRSTASRCQWPSAVIEAKFRSQSA